MQIILIHDSWRFKKKPISKKKLCLLDIFFFKKNLDLYSLNQQMAPLFQTCINLEHLSKGKMKNC